MSRATWRRALLLVLIYGLVAQLVILWRGWLANPFARVPFVDAAAYWQWGGRIADGRLVDDHPFFAAPLYPYFVGLVRALGGGMLALYLVQALLHLWTAAVLARLGRRTFTPLAGLVTAVLWVGLNDPGYSTGRILAGTLQCLLVAWMLDRAAAVARAPSTRRCLGLGALTGVTALAWPPTLLVLPLLALWTARLASWRQGLATLALGVTCVLPATLHNLLASKGELIPITAHAGVTFYHGNNATANGTFAPVGVSIEKSEHHVDALHQTRAALGDDAGWGDVSGFFFDKGFDWWRADPGHALLIAGKKLWWFTFGRLYGDMYFPALEAFELQPSLLLCPIEMQWLMLGGLLAAAAFVRRDPRRHVPALLVLLVSLLVCVVFWYSPRYRLPAAPAVVLFWGGAFTRTPLRRLVGAAFVFSAIVVLGLHMLLAFDATGTYLPWFRTRAMAAFSARALAAHGGEHYQEAVALYARALDLDPDNARTEGALSRSLMALERHDEAVVHLQRAVSLRPGDEQLRYDLGVAHHRAGEPGLAIHALDALLEQDPLHEAARQYLVHVLKSVGRDQEAVARLREGLELFEGHFGIRLVLAWTLATSPDDGARDGAEALRHALVLAAAAPRDAEVLDTLAAAYAEVGKWTKAQLEAQSALERIADDAPPEVRAALEARLAGYREQRAHREQPARE